jgi:uncharacterized membrane protein
VDRKTEEAIDLWALRAKGGSQAISFQPGNTSALLGALSPEAQRRDSMNKMLAAAFDDERTAYEGLAALKELHKNGDISLYATAVVTKDAAGTVSVKQTADAGPQGTALGLLTGGVVGVLAGPVGVAAGAYVGALTGALFDLNNAGIDANFLDDLSKALSPGKTAVLADIDEAWTTPVDAKLVPLGALVFRRLRSEVAEDQLVRERADFEAELRQLQEELKQARAQDKAAIQKEIDTVTRKIEIIGQQAKDRAAQLKAATDAKVASLTTQMKQAGEKQKARIEKRIAEARADFKGRNEKLESAQEALYEATLPAR